MFDCGQNNDRDSVLEDVFGAALALAFAFCALIGIAAFYSCAAVLVVAVWIVSTLDGFLHVFTGGPRR